MGPMQPEAQSCLLVCNTEISVAWVKVCHLYLSSEFGHTFFQSSATKPVFMKLLYMRQLPFFEAKKKKKSIQHGTNEDLHILLLSRFYTSPLFYFFWNCSHLHHNVLHDTKKIVFSFPPKFCLVVNTSKSSSVLKKTVSKWHVLVKICHDQRLSPQHEKAVLCKMLRRIKLFVWQMSQ